MILFFTNFSIDINTKQSKEFCSAMISNLNTLIDAEQQAKRVIEGLLASGMTELQEIFKKHHDEKVAILNAAEQQREALKKQFIALQLNADASYKEFEKNHMELQNLVSLPESTEFRRICVFFN